MTEPDPKRVLQAALLERAAQWGSIPGDRLAEACGMFPQLYGERRVMSWILEILQPDGDPESRHTVWRERVAEGARR